MILIFHEPRVPLLLLSLFFSQSRSPYFYGKILIFNQWVIFCPHRQTALIKLLIISNREIVYKVISTVKIVKATHKKSFGQNRNSKRNAIDEFSSFLNEQWKLKPDVCKLCPQRNNFQLGCGIICTT